MIIKNKMSAVLAACLFMVNVSDLVAMNAPEFSARIETKDITVDQSDENKLIASPVKKTDIVNEYDERLKSINDKGFVYVKGLVNEIIKELDQRLTSKLNGESLTVAGESASVDEVCDIANAVASKCRTIIKEHFMEPADTYIGLMSRVSSLDFFANVGKHTGISDLFIHVANIDKMIDSNTGYSQRNNRKVMFGGSIVDYANKILGKEELNRAEVLNFISKILSFENVMGKVQKLTIKESTDYFKALYIVLTAPEKKTTLHDKAVVSKEDADRIFEVFGKVNDNSELACFFIDSVTKQVKESFVKTSKRMLKQLDKLQKVLSKEASRNPGYTLEEQMELIKVYHSLISEFSLKSEELSVVGGSVDEIDAKVLVMGIRGFIDLCEKTDKLIIETQVALNDYYMKLTSTQSIKSDKLASKFIAKFAHDFGKGSDYIVKGSSNVARVKAEFKRLARGGDMIKGSDVNKESILAILKAIGSDQIGNHVGIDSMTSRLIKYIRESNLPVGEYLKEKGKKGMFGLYDSLCGISHTISGVFKKTDEEKAKALQLKNEVKQTKAAEYVDKRARAATDYFNSDDYKSRYSEELKNPKADNILDGYIVLAPYDPKKGEKGMTVKDHDALIRYLESLPEFLRKDTFDKVEKYTGRRVEDITGKVDLTADHRFRRGGQHFKSSKNRVIPVSYKNFRIGQYQEYLNMKGKIIEDYNNTNDDGSKKTTVVHQDDQD